MILWGGLSPYVLQKVAADESLVTLSALAINSMTTARISKDGFERDMDQFEGGTPYVPGLFECPRPNVSRQSFDVRVEDVATSVQVHVHTFTCRKGKSGKLGCRSQQPQEIRNKETGPTQLFFHPDDEEKLPGKRRVIGEDEITELNETDPCLRHYPLYCPDKRTIAWELHRPHVGDCNHPCHIKNGRVVAFSPAMIACIGCNTANYLLGSAEQAKATCFYMLDYVVKNTVELTNSLSVIYEARKTAMRYPSRADDRGTDSRNTKYLLTKILSGLQGKSEVPSSMAAAACIGASSTICSDKFWYVYIRPAIAFVKTKLGHSLDNTSTNNPSQNESDTHNDYMMPDDECYVDFETNIFDEENSKWQAPSDKRSGEMFVVNDKFITIEQHIHYAYRGHELRFYCFLEYCSIIIVVPRSSNNRKRKRGDMSTTNPLFDEFTEETNEQEHDSDNEGSHTQPENISNTNKRFQFDCRHPLHTTHEQMIRSVFMTPILAGTQPPSLPFPPSETNRTWLRNAKDFSEYYITLLVPWDLDTLVPSTVSYDFNGFKQWSSQFKKDSENPLDEEPSFIEKCKFAMVNITSSNLRISNAKKVLLTKWRGRCATKWNSTNCDVPTSSESSAQPASRLDDSFLDDDAVANIVSILINQSTRSEGADQKINAFINYQERSLSQIFDGVIHRHEILNTITADRMTMQSGRIISHFDVSASSDIVKKLKEKQTDDDIESDMPLHDEDEFYPAIDENLLNVSVNSSNLDSDQKRALLKVLNYVNTRISTPEEVDNNLHLIISGGPGNGKSTLAKEIIARVEAANGKVHCCAPTGMAASLIPNAVTMHSLFKLPVNHEKGEKRNKPVPKLSDADLIKCRKSFENCVLLLIDETSMIDVVNLSHINARLQEIKESTLPFGGIGIILSGDFFQLPPVNGETLFTSAMLPLSPELEGTPYAIGKALFEKFSMINLTHQHRSLDPDHTAMIQKLRSCEELNPLNHDVIDSLKVLTHKDVEEDESWLEAPIVVCGNLDRKALNYSQAKRFAIRKGVPIIKWKQPLTGRVASQLNDITVDLLYETQTELTGLFVEGAPAYLLQNIEPTKGLANGTPLELHSITLCPDDDPDTYRQLINDALPGEVITIPTPAMINVRVPSADPSKWPLNETLVPGEVVIPLPLDSHRDNCVSLDETKISFKSFIYEVAFSITFHKIQGKTVPKIILDLNRRPGQRLGKLTFYGVYVGLSRVKYSADIRILPIQPNESLAHLKRLKPHEELTDWLHCVNKV